MIKTARRLLDLCDVFDDLGDLLEVLLTLLITLQQLADWVRLLSQVKLVVIDFQLTRFAVQVDWSEPLGSLLLPLLFRRPCVASPIRGLIFHLFILLLVMFILLGC